MNKAEFKAMWDNMQRDGYFVNHPHYCQGDDLVMQPSDNEMDMALRQLDFSLAVLTMPFPYSVELEKSIKRTEPFWLCRMFDLPKSGLAIDLGCGYGRSVSWLRERYEQVIGFDISESIIEKAKENFKDIENVIFFVSDPDQFPSEIRANSADFIYAFTVFQHIHRDYTLSYIRKAAEKLKPGGLFVFNLLCGLNEGIDDGDYGVEWAIGYSKDQAREMLVGVGLTLEKMVQWSAEGAPASWLWISARRS